MRAMSRLWPFLLLACDGGGGSSPSAPTSSSGGIEDDEGDCRFVSTLSGGLRASFTGSSAVCAYTSGGVSLSEIGGDRVVVVLEFPRLKALSTGSTPATVDVHQQRDDVWRGATCTLNVESNERVSRMPTSDAGSSAFDNYLIKGTGSCSTPATFRGDGGTKPPVEISPFTFTLRTLFY